MFSSSISREDAGMQLKWYLGTTLVIIYCVIFICRKTYRQDFSGLPKKELPTNVKLKVKSQVNDGKFFYLLLTKATKKKKETHYYQIPVKKFLILLARTFKNYQISLRWKKEER
jgi:hypothetical protein